VTLVSSASRIRGTIVYRVRLALLSVFGPATLDDEHDPIVQLKREYQRQKGAGAAQPADRGLGPRRPRDGDTGGHGA